VQTIAKDLNRKIYFSATGFVDKGLDFGSGDVNFLKMPKVALLGGDQTSSLGHGEIWHFFEQQIHFPVSAIPTDYFKTVDLTKYTVLIVPDGNYRLFDEGQISALEKWVTDGGRLILIANGAAAFADKKGFALKEFVDEDAKKKQRKRKRSRKKKKVL